jgi:hypothetical protein
VKRALFVFVLVGCKQSDGADCKSAVANALRFDDVKYTQVFEERCVADAWSAEARACLHDAKSGDDVDGCGKHLTEAQKRAVSEATQKLDGPRPDSLECYAYEQAIAAGKTVEKPAGCE